MITRQIEEGMEAPSLFLSEPDQRIGGLNLFAGSKKEKERHLRKLRSSSWTP